MRSWIRVCFRIALGGGEGGKNSTFDNLGKLDNVFLEFQQRFNVTQHFEIFQKIELNRCSA